MMSRTFRDPSGAEWRVWLVTNSYGERRVAIRRVAVAQPPHGERRTQPDRRKRPTLPRSAVAPGYENGWLCFENDKGEKRRLVPVPGGWDRASDYQLWRLSEVASRR